MPNRAGDALSWQLPRRGPTACYRHEQFIRILPNATLNLRFRRCALQTEVKNIKEETTKNDYCCQSRLSDSDDDGEFTLCTS